MTLATRQGTQDRTKSRHTHLAPVAVKDAVDGRIRVLQIIHHVEAVLHMWPASLDGIHPDVTFAQLPGSLGLLGRHIPLACAGQAVVLPRQPQLELHPNPLEDSPQRVPVEDTLECQNNEKCKNEGFVRQAVAFDNAAKPRNIIHCVQYLAFTPSLHPAAAILITRCDMGKMVGSECTRA